MTSCPPEIARILLEMLSWGYDPEQLLYYWDVERLCYIDATTPEFAGALQPLWQQLEPHIELIRSTIAHS